MATVGLAIAGNSILPGIGGVVGGFVRSNSQYEHTEGNETSNFSGTRLESLQIQVSTHGNAVPRVYGLMRLAGNVIWARPLREVATTTTVNGTTTTSYSYFATVAIAICEGPILAIDEVWANSVRAPFRGLYAFDVPGNFALEEHKGTEIQQVSPLIESFEGAGMVPAYKGIAYIVIRDFPLDNYDSRLPNFTFNVNSSPVSDLVSDSARLFSMRSGRVILGPGHGPFEYGTTIVTRQKGILNANDVTVPVGQPYPINQKAGSTVSDMQVSAGQLFPRFGQILGIKIKPVWYYDPTPSPNAPPVVYPSLPTDMATTRDFFAPYDWTVGNVAPSGVLHIIPNTSNGKPLSGGTPSDRSIMECIQYFNSISKFIFFEPTMINIRLINGKRQKTVANGLSAESLELFMSRGVSRTYKDFIMHYVNLLGSSVFDFSVGDGLFEATKVSDGSGNYPAVMYLASIISDIKTIVPSLRVSYSADWREYNAPAEANSSLNREIMTPIWQVSDFISINAFYPITPDLLQSEIDASTVQTNWEAAEGWDYSYNATRTVQTPFTSRNRAWKDFVAWSKTTRNSALFTGGSTANKLGGIFTVSWLKNNVSITNLGTVSTGVNARLTCVPVYNVPREYFIATTIAGPLSTTFFGTRLDVRIGNVLRAGAKFFVSVNTSDDFLIVNGVYVKFTESVIDSVKSSGSGSGTSSGLRLIDVFRHDVGGAPWISFRILWGTAIVVAIKYSLGTLYTGTHVNLAFTPVETVPRFVIETLFFNQDTVNMPPSLLAVLPPVNNAEFLVVLDHATKSFQALFLLVKGV